MLVSIDLDSLNIVGIWSFTDLIFPQAENADLVCKFLYSVQMREDTDQKNYTWGH